MASYKFGVIGMIRDELARDKWGALEKLAKAGYNGIESSLDVGESESEWKEHRKRLDDLGLEMAGINCSHSKPEEMGKTIDKAKTLGCELIMTYWGPTESDDQLLKEAEVLEKLAVQCADAGLKYCYHNHDHEFSFKCGEKKTKYAVDLLLDNAPHLYLELDIAWCLFGGADPITYIRRMGHRIPIIHVKDLYDLNVRGCFTTVGTGVVPCASSIEAAAAKGTKWMVVEQDQPRNLTHFESAIVAIQNLREIGVAPSPQS